MVVIDTNVIYSGLRSKRGASYRLLGLIGEGCIPYAVSISLLFEYEDVLRRNIDQFKLSSIEVDDFLDAIALMGSRQIAKFLWRPYLNDPKDDHILELAVVSNSDIIITYNNLNTCNFNHSFFSFLLI